MLMEVLTIGLIAISVLGLFLANPIWALATTPASDATAIRAEYEGITSKAGPYTMVIDIKRAGIQLGSRSEPTLRLYDVALKRQNGEVGHLIVGIEASFFGGGKVSTIRRLN